MAASVSERVGTPEHGARPRWWRCGLLAALLAGATLRVIWVEDMEYKADESWIFERVQNAGRSEPFPSVGLPTSLQFANPGMSIWPFVALGRLAGVREPTDLARAVQVLNVVALCALALFALRWVAADQRELWVWAVALAALNPLAILFQRKIWPPSIAPLVSVLLLMAWWRRDRRWGAFACGLIGALLGQMHLSGFFFFTALMGWALLFERRRVIWSSWLAGGFCGLLAGVPWLAHLARESAPWPAQARFWTHLPEPKFWTHWISEPLGIGLKYSLGEDFTAFLSGPLWSGQPTYLVAVLHGAVAALGLAIAGGAAFALWRQRRDWRALLIGRRSETAFLVSAAALGYGLVLNAACLRFYRHYLLVAFPLTFVWLAQLALEPARGGALPRRRARALLLALCLAQGLISLSFLSYVHAQRRGIRGDYGLPYARQERTAALAVRTHLAP